MFFSLMDTRHFRMEKLQAREKALLHISLVQLGEALATLLAKLSPVEESLRVLKSHTVAFLGYLTSHESYHCVGIELILTQSGHSLDRKVSYTACGNEKCAKLFSSYRTIISINYKATTQGIQ